MTSQFTWIPFYRELANALSSWQDRQAELIAFLEALREQGYVITKLMDKDEDGANFLLQEIDPFTFFGVFNRWIRTEQRIGILKEMKGFFNLESPLPSDFEGIPVVNNFSSWFIAYKRDRGLDDVKKLWRVFQLALDKDPLTNDEFIKSFDDALTVKQTNLNLTMGLFWIRPEAFLNLDHVNRKYLKVKLPPKGLTAKFYIDTLNNASKIGKTFPEISIAAFNAKEKIPSGGSGDPDLENVNYWMVGAYWDESDPADQTERFVAEGIWMNGYEDRYLDDVNSMQVGDRIAIKASATQRLGLPFDNRNKTVSRMDIKAVGTIVANRKDGRTVEVEWETDFSEKSWYFYTNRLTVWHVKDRKNVWKEAADQLIKFVWYGQPQDYDWFIHQWWDKGTPPGTSGGNSGQIPLPGNRPYSVDDIVTDGVFLSVDELDEILARLNDKKAMIIQGPPGVGKTFIAKKLAYAQMNEVDKERVEFVQFHQSYSYDDFVRGYRPLPGQAGSFGLKNGIFYEFCQKAIQDPDRPYVFIIDEINRGNLSQIFGELLMLIEHDKRGTEHSVPLVYQNANEPRFYIPSNLYLIGLMNLADRSLAMVDYALRRRFSFITLVPKYEDDCFSKWLSGRSMKPDLIQLIINKISALNKIIREDPLLGENYQIGHSYFCPKGDHFEGLDEKWFRSIVKSEIIPLIKEYWFDNPKKAQDAERNLLN